MKRTISVAGLLAVCACPLYATDPQAIDVGGLALIPTLQVSQAYDDNIFSQATNETDSWTTEIKPEAQLVAEFGESSVALIYRGHYAEYWDSEQDNFDDHTLSAAFDLGGGFHGLTLDVDYARIHDNRGEGGSEGIIAASRLEPDVYDNTQIGVGWTMGEESQFGLELKFLRNIIDYQNNRSETKFRDRFDTAFSARAYARLAPKSRAFAEYENRELDYDTDPIVGGTLDSEEDKFSIGLAWEATARTSGEISFGQTDKVFKDPARGTKSFSNWDASVSWAPRTYSVVTFGTGRSPGETNGTGDFIETTEYSVDWRHVWMNRLTSNMGVSLGQSEYNNNPREDDLLSYDLGLNYSLDRWIDFGAAYKFTERDSSIAIYGYDKTRFQLTLDVSL